MSHAPEKSEQYMRETVTIIKRSLAYPRTLIAELCPPEVYDAGLPASVQWLAKQMANGLTVDLHITSESWTLPPDRTMLLYRLIRELLINVVKHAAVDRATVSIHVDSSNTLVMKVQDGGRGFDTASAIGNGASAHFGLRHIRERITMMGGGYQADSTIGHGTTITLSLPLNQQRGRKRGLPIIKDLSNPPLTHS